MDEKDLKKVIAESLKPVGDLIGAKQLDEAYVAQPKTYMQVTDLLSQRSKDAHTEIYNDYVKKLNEVSAKLDIALTGGDPNQEHSLYRSLKVDEAFLTNAVYLHEMFFANCFDPHSELFMDTLSYMRLQRDFGTFEKWQSDFMACAQSNRDGWAVCGYNMFLKRFVNIVIDGHAGNVMLGLLPIIVVDTHGHAYFRDYLDDRKSYIVAMMRELNWEVIEERFRKLEKVHEAVR